MHRDIAHFASSKLQGEWSAADFGKYLTKENLQALLPRYDKLEPLVRVRLLLSVIPLDAVAKQSLNPELQTLIEAAREDKEEWVSITAKALGTFDGSLDLRAVLDGSAVVKKSMAELELLVASGDSSHSFRPLEEAYMSKGLVDAARGGPEPAIEHSYFSHRDGGAGNMPELYRRASASAAAAAASVQPSSTPASPSQPQAARTHEAAAPYLEPGPPSSHRPTASGVFSLSRHAPGVEDMFRSSRPATGSSARPAASSASTQPERKADARPVHVKLLDVSEVKKLSRQHAPAASDHSNAAANGHAQEHAAEEDKEIEEGELEAGELVEMGQSAPSAKRMRHAQNTGWSTEARSHNAQRS